MGTHATPIPVTLAPTTGPLPLLRVLFFLAESDAGIAGGQPHSITSRSRRPASFERIPLSLPASIQLRLAA